MWNQMIRSLSDGSPVYRALNRTLSDHDHPDIHPLPLSIRYILTIAKSIKKEKNDDNDSLKRSTVCATLSIIY